MSIIELMRAFDPIGTDGKADAALEVYLTIAAARLSVCVWAGLYSQGLALLALHLMNVATVRSASSQGGAGGPVTMETAGRVSVQYAKPDGWEKNPLLLTPWGTDFMALANKLPGRRMFNTGFRLEDMCHPNPALMGEDN